MSPGRDERGGFHLLERASQVLLCTPADRRQGPYDVRRLREPGSDETIDGRVQILLEGNHLVDESESKRLLRSKHAAGNQKFQGAGSTYGNDQIRSTTPGGGNIKVSLYESKPGRRRGEAAGPQRATAG